MAAEEKTTHGETTTPVLALVGAMTLLALLWPAEQDRPSLRWLRKMTGARLLPYRKIGHRVFFDPAEVRRVVDRKFKVEARP
jgi:hypothetical protein